jgi:hypothetical protein
MKRITVISQSIFLLALIPIGVVLAQPKPIEPVQATVAQTQVVQTPVISDPVIVEPVEVIAEPTIVDEQPVVEAPVVSPPATVATYNELLRQHGYADRFNSGARSATMYMFTYKLAEQYPERFTLATVAASIDHIHNVFLNTPDPEWTNVYLNFTW